MLDRIKSIWKSERIEDYIKENKDVLMKVAAAAVLVVAAFFVFILSEDKQAESVSDNQETIVEAESETPVILVDIGGEVINPMVAELEEGSRVEDAINAAGGVTDDADLTEINRAAFLEDGDKILIPTKSDKSENASEADTPNGGTETGTVYQDERVNINTADSEQLQTLTGIGPVTAEKIIEYREENGRFDNIEDIKNVSGIGEKTFEKLKDDIRT